MRDLILITKTPLTSESIFNILKTAFPSFKVLDLHTDHLLMKSKTQGFEIYFTPDDVLSDPANMMGDETIAKVPSCFQFLTNIGYTSASIAKKLIISIQNEIGDFWIDDDDFEWLGSSKDFLVSNHQETKEQEIISHNRSLR